ncbi:MAG TPA: M1 family aminopeptidase [Vicinamibacterales bacterium]|nr:M1 family aminopeptidase [Vicinamibacterales bacterium]
MRRISDTPCLAVAVVAALAVSSPALAQRLPVDVTPSHYDLSFDVDLANARFGGTETIRVDVAQPTRTVTLNAAEITFRQVTIETAAGTQTATVTPDEGRQTATLRVPKTIAKGPAQIHITYGGILNDKLRGFYLSTEKDQRYAVTQFEATDARRAFPGFDEPAFKATFDVALTIDHLDAAISNGKVISDTPTSDGARHTVKFSTTPKMSTYLVAMAVGRLACIEGSAESIPIRICGGEGKQEMGRIALDMTQQILKFYNTYFTIKYPYGKLDVLAVPDFAAGAMENTAAIFYRERDLFVDSKDASLAARKRIAQVLAHEMAHQWFGDLVTMKWWDDIWLNEGFANWMENRPLGSIRPDWNVPVDEAIGTQAALGVDALKTTHAIHAAVETPAQIDEAFDDITYEKGAAVLRMVENYLGPDVFRKGINTYLQQHAYGNATSEDFWTTMATVSGKPVDRILPSFINQPGAPLLEIALQCVNDRAQLDISQQRFFIDPTAATQTRSAQRWQIPVCVKTAGGGGGCDLIADNKQTLSLGNSCLPWAFANAGAQGYYRTAYSPDTLRGLAPRIQEVLTAPERLSLSADEWALVRAGRHQAADYLTLAAGFAMEHTNGVLSGVADRFDTIDEYLTTAETRPRFQQFVRTLFSPLFQEIGFTSTSVDSDERRALRATLIHTLGITGNDVQLAATARAAVDRALQGGTPLDPTLARSIVNVAARSGDASLFDAFIAASDRATSPDERYRYLYALAQFRDPALIDRALALSITPKLRSQDTARFLATFIGEESSRSRAWAFVKAHWTELEPKVTIFGGDTTMTSSLGNFCDAASRDDVASFFKQHPVPSAARTLTQTIELINNCIAFKSAQTDSVTEFLRK